MYEQAHLYIYGLEEIGEGGEEGEGYVRVVAFVNTFFFLARFLVSSFPPIP